MSKSKRLKSLKLLTPKKAPNYQGLPIVDSRILPKLAKDILKSQKKPSSFIKQTYTASGLSYNAGKGDIQRYKMPYVTV